MKNLKITKGEWVVDKNCEYLILTDKGAYSPNAMLKTTETRIAIEANAQLIADAGTTANKCGKLPSELLAERDELLEVLQMFVDYCYGTEMQNTERFKKGVKAINKTLSK